ncbi:glycosyltransferase [Vibrio vulnificus]|uniref:glycosyltransferase n=1 Tax=Vibrio vulnificus TaxID=672 RepID=UPI001A1DFC0C|nr:glycosyltransferase [Vibrio vulnificus]MDS1828744.1 glycosyltransferase [Vibrio vulnificus]HAS8318998.1 glycosyltransferase [Vibrio vulnificus]
MRDCQDNNKIIHIINSLGTGGAEGALFRLIKHSSNPTNHVVVTLLGGGPYKKKLENLGVSVKSYNFKSFSIVFDILSLYYFLIKNRKSIIQTWLYHSDLIGGLLTRLSFNPKLIWTIRNTAVHKNSKMTKCVQYLCSVLSNCIPMAIISCSHVAKEYHANLGYNKLIEVIPNGYDVAAFCDARKNRNKNMSKFGLSNKPFVIGCVARFDEQKDHCTLLKAFLSAIKSGNIPSDSILALAGEGIDMKNSNLVSLLSNFNLIDNVKLFGVRSDILELMSCFDVSILTSLSEAFPNVLAESMGVGVPCIATDVGDSCIIIGKNGWLSNPRDVESITDNIIKSYSWYLNESFNNELRNRCIDETRNRYSIETMVESFEKVWSRFI